VPAVVCGETTIVDAALRILDGLSRLASGFCRIASWTLPPVIIVILATVLASQLRLSTIVVWGFDVPLFGDRLTVTGLTELQWHLFAAMVMLGIVYAVDTDAHVRIDFVAGRWTARTRVIIELIGDTLLLLPFTLFMLHFSWRFTGTAFNTGERSTTGGLEDRYLVKGLMPLGFALLAIVVVVKIIQHIVALTGRGSGPASVDWFTRRQTVTSEESMTT
jgi:TRAP-type mannitol/chloroaromatic compound transport system permease small subunit